MLKYEHLTQNENIEKLNHPHLIGKFGVGLKDALATFYRHKVDVIIKSKFCDISLGMSPKTNFSDVITLHAYVKEPSYPSMPGTEFILNNCEDCYIEQAKSFFWDAERSECQAVMVGIAGVIFSTPKGG
jgi:hypothetical protein